MRYHKYTTEQIEWLQLNVPGKFFNDITKKFNEVFSENRTEEGINCICRRNEIKNNIYTKFTKNNNPKNKHKNYSVRRRDSNGDQIKINEKWISYSKYIYEQKYGTVPKGYVIYHLDGDTHNNNIDNLVCINNYDTIRLSRYNCTTAEQRKVVLNLLRLKDKVKEKKNKVFNDYC